MKEMKNERNEKKSMTEWNQEKNEDQLKGKRTMNKEKGHLILKRMSINPKRKKNKGNY